MVVAARGRGIAPPSRHRTQGGSLLTVEQLEQLRLLTNTDMDSRSSLGLVLLGQPTLRRRLNPGETAGE